MYNTFTEWQDIAKIHNRDLEYIKSKFRGAVVKQWANDEFTLGAFAMFSPYQVRKHF